MKEQQKQKISILFPLDVLAALRESAKRHERSFNGDVIWALLRFHAYVGSPAASLLRQ